MIEYLDRTTCPLKHFFADEPHTLRHHATVHVDRPDRRVFDVVRCESCDLGLTTPYPSAETLPELYLGRDTLTNFDPIRGTVMDRLKDLAAAADLRWIHRRAGRGRIQSMLDFGTGNGRFAIVGARVFGCAVDAIDFHSEAPDAFRRAPVPVRYRPIERFFEDDDVFDLIVLRHVLEHDPDPVGFLQSLVRRLSAQGAIYVEVPNLASAYIRAFGARINALAVPFHLFHFTPTSLARVLRAVGLDADIREKEMPMVGGIIASLAGQERTLVHQIAGVALQPMQLAAGWIAGKPCVTSVSRRV